MLPYLLSCIFVSNPAGTSSPPWSLGWLEDCEISSIEYLDEDYRNNALRKCREWGENSLPHNHPLWGWAVVPADQEEIEGGPLGWADEYSTIICIPNQIGDDSNWYWSVDEQE